MLIFATGLAGFAQPYYVSGRVFDAETSKPLAFVNIVINHSIVGGVSDIDGRFRLTSNEPIESLRFSYVGYAQQVYNVESTDDAPVIKMEQLTFHLPEITIVAGENPAHRIIENAILNRDRNNYERLPAFSYTSYDKMIFTVDADTLIVIDTLAVDTSMLRLKEFLEEQYFFIMETVAERKFLYPGRNQQKVIASRVSGLKDPIFTFLISQLQSTSFYDDVISISDKNYVNPISRGSTTRYSFILEDTLFMAGSPDTTFIISFKPRNNTNFDGLKGLLYINSNLWAIQNVIAEPDRQEKGMAIKIQQMYELIEGLYWFPVQLNTDIILKNVEVNGYNPLGQGKSYISNISVNPQLVRRMFSEVDIDVDPNAAYVSDTEWEKLRVVDLSEKERRTYHVIDSLGQEENLDRYAQMLESFLSGNIPLGKFHIPMKRLFRYNAHEKVYLGVGLATGPRINKIFSGGAYVGYGFGDKQVKYGTAFNLDLHRYRDLGWFISLENDLSESGKIDPFSRGSHQALTDYRSLLIRQMDHTKAVATGLQYRVFPYLLAHVELDRSWKAPQYDYFYSQSNEEPFPKAWVFTELSAGFRFAWREKIIQTTRSRFSLGSDFPILSFRFTQGLNGFLDGEFSYRRYDLKIEQSFYTKYLGETSVLILAGLIDSGLPYMQLYSGFGSYGCFAIHAAESFSTMRMNEFTADQYATIYLSHNFGKLLFRTRRFEPEFVIATHAGFGRLVNQQPEHHSIELQGFEKGYFESGLLINNMLNLQFFNVGLGAFYRYGPYALEGFRKNTALRLSLVFPF